MIDASPSSFRVDGVRAAGWARRRLSLAAGDASCGRPSRAVVTPFGWTILLRLGNVVLASHPPNSNSFTFYSRSFGERPV